MSRKPASPLRDRVVEVIMGETGAGVDEANSLYSRVLGEIIDHIKRNDRTIIRGLGSFTWVNRKARRTTGGLFGTRIPAYRHLKFRSAAMKGGR